METINISDFCEYCSLLHNPKIYFNSQDQSDKSDTGNIKIKFQAERIKITRNPNVIYLFLGENYISINNIKHIVRLKDEIIGAVFKVICGDFFTDENNNEYVITIL